MLYFALLCITVSSTLWRQREEYCARLIQNAWRKHKLHKETPYATGDETDVDHHRHSGDDDGHDDDCTDGNIHSDDGDGGGGGGGGCESGDGAAASGKPYYLPNS